MAKEGKTVIKTVDAETVDVKTYCSLSTAEIIEIINALGRIGEQLEEDDGLWKNHIAPVLILAADELKKRLKQ